MNGLLPLRRARGQATWFRKKMRLDGGKNAAGASGGSLLQGRHSAARGGHTAEGHFVFIQKVWRSYTNTSIGLLHAAELLLRVLSKRFQFFLLGHGTCKFPFKTTDAKKCFFTCGPRSLDIMPELGHLLWTKRADLITRKGASEAF